MATKKDTPKTDKAEATDAEQQVPPQFRVMAQYIRDFSFENIFAQSGQSEAEKPQSQLNVNVLPKKLDDGSFEVALKVNITTETPKQKYYLLELDYCGRFEIQNVPDQQMLPMLLIECPRILFPFVRRIVADTTREGGFLPLNIDSVDFVAMYRQQMEAQMKAQAEAKDKVKS